MKKSFSAFLIAAPFILISQPSYAYLDPGTGAFLLQALLGGVAGVLVVGRIYWAKIKGFFRGTPAKSPEAAQPSRIDEA
ncbi:hypothetical protein [Pelagibius sp. Alg239-R121]|uniref:hypothetical protein n=1 Tax=Pelagibius sp. Alg239-R121 TaxID=2993448 RepID=UPI0024A70D8E|nr:hypothetical protein [Pelagibius sp. Alg239-R121]